MSPANPAPFTSVEIATSSVAVAISALAIGLKLWARTLKNSRLGAADYLILLAFVLTLARWALHVAGYRTTQFSFGNAAARNAPLVSASDAVFAAAAASAKLSLLFTYREMLCLMPWIRRALWSFVTVAVLLLLVNLLGLAAVCSLLDPYSGRNGARRCAASYRAGLGFIFVGNIGTYALLGFMPLIWVCMGSASLPRGERMGLNLMLALGTVIVLAAGYQVRAFHTGAFQHLKVQVLLATLELHCVLLAASLPFAGAAFTRIGEKVMGAWEGMRGSKAADLPVVRGKL